MAKRSIKNEARVVGAMFANKGESVLEGLLRGYELAGASPRMVAKMKREIEAAKANGHPDALPVR